MDPPIAVVDAEHSGDRVDGTLQGADQSVRVERIPIDAMKLDGHGQWGRRVPGERCDHRTELLLDAPHACHGVLSPVADCREVARDYHADGHARPSPAS
jgi:hypothetical protein